jgi:hypothetical protein
MKKQRIHLIITCRDRILTLQIQQTEAGADEDCGWLGRQQRPRLGADWAAVAEGKRPRATRGRATGRGGGVAGQTQLSSMLRAARWGGRSGGPRGGRLGCAGAGAPPGAEDAAAPAMGSREQERRKG